ncbi:MAG: hypothetical protein O2807_06710 [bacterium]|nr:hypothetical protein [bacterium]
MGAINIEDLQAGMVLADDVLTREGRTLLRKGNQITQKHINIFKAWGVTEADINGVTKEDAIASAISRFDTRIYQDAEQAIESIFAHTDKNHPFVSELLRLCIFRDAEKRQDAEK